MPMRLLTSTAWEKTVSASAKQTDVKAAEKAKATVLSVEEKALKTLKGWLSPESEDEWKK